jgi:hypothetical protein
MASPLPSRLSAAAVAAPCIFSASGASFANQGAITVRGGGGGGFAAGGGAPGNSGISGDHGAGGAGVYFAATGGSVTNLGSALISIGPELHLIDGAVLFARFDGEFTSNGRTVVGRAGLRYDW